jgi:hypothetical protein
VNWPDRVAVDIGGMGSGDRELLAVYDVAMCIRDSAQIDPWV